MFMIFRTFILVGAIGVPLASSAQSPVEIILSDNFDRQETDDKIEQIGNGWTTNSNFRAGGMKQVDLIHGALFIQRREGANHGVSVSHDVSFQNGGIRLRFKLDTLGDLGINFADLTDKTVRSGHLCMVRVTGSGIELIDLKTGRDSEDMKAARRELAKSGGDPRKLLSSKSRTFTQTIAPDQWHDLAVEIDKDRMQVALDGQDAGSFTSEGIAHPHKTKLRLAVDHSAWVDDVVIERF
jgi:hypothetical protein